MAEPPPLMGDYKSVGPYAGLIFAGLCLIAGILVPLPDHCSGDRPLYDAAVPAAFVAAALDFGFARRRRQGLAGPLRVAFWSAAIGLITVTVVSVLRSARLPCG
jgi:hypothetical protein